MNFHIKNFRNYLVLTFFSLIFFWSAYSFCGNFFVNPVYDSLVKLTSPARMSEDIVVVTIDDSSINKIGRWPWKRKYYADIFEYLENIARAKTIAFDSVLVSYGEKNDDTEFFKRFSALKRVIPGVFFSKNKSHFLNKNEEQLHKIFSAKFFVNVEDKRNKEFKKASEYASSSFSLKEIIDSSQSMGSVLSFPDKDGIIRKAEHLFRYKESYYPSLALAVYKQLYPGAKFMLQEKFFKVTTEKNSFDIPVFTDKNGSFSYIKWYRSENGSYPYNTISAWKVIRSYENIKKGKPSLLDASVFTDKIVVIGATSTATRDIKSTPLKFDYPGVYIQATVIDNVLNNEFIHRSSKFQEILVLFITVIIGFLAIFYLQPLYSSILLTFLAVGYFYVCLFFLYPNNFAPDPVTPVVFIACTMLLGYGYKYFMEDARKGKVKKLIAKYVSKDIMEEILKDPDRIKLKGKRSDISILFVDIRNFTYLSEILDPEQVSELLNEYFSVLIPVIFKYSGTVNKFIGDAVMVIFGAPLENSDHPQNAVKCAFEILKKINELKVKWVLEENKPDISIGIGISSGEAFVGNVGSEERFEYSAIGNTVNVANRLEGFNKLYKTSILISESTYERVKDTVKVEEIDSVHVTQNSEPIKIFELKGLK